jgi:phage major tail protein, phi13 family
MKKVFSFGLLAAATMLVAFSSCKENTPDAKKKVTGVTLSETTKTIAIGEEFTLTATVAPADAADKSVMWTSDDSNVATVDGGKVTGIAEGEATITVTTKDGGKTDACKIKVNKREPVSRNAILLEDFTGTWCEPCYYAMGKLHKILPAFGDKVILVCHHLNSGAVKDDFAISHSSTLAGFYGLKYIPYSMLDRTPGIVGKEVLFSTSSVSKEILDKRLAQPTNVTINLTTSYNEATKEIKVKVEGELLEDYPKAKLNVYLIQDGIVAYQNGGGDKYVHHNALRDVISKDTWGDALGVAQGKYSKEYTYKLPEKIGKFATDPAKMYIVAFVADAVNTSGDNTKNIVHNSVIKAIK